MPLQLLLEIIIVINFRGPTEAVPVGSTGGCRGGSKAEDSVEPIFLVPVTVTSLRH